MPQTTIWHLYDQVYDCVEREPGWGPGETYKHPHVTVDLLVYLGMVGEEASMI